METEGGENVTVSGLDNWSITTTRPSYDSMPKGRQYIVWPENASIRFNGKGSVYLYFTLQYPGNDAGGKATWSEYAAKVGGSTLDNTMYVYGFPSVVTHELRETGKALLQKGVYGMYYYDDSATAQRTYTQAGSSRTVYNNRDSKNRAVAYYVTLYNGGSKRLYLNDLYDKLPDGFTFLHMLQNGNLSRLSLLQTITTPGGTNLTNPLVNAEGVKYCSVGITAEKTEGGVMFRITKPESGSNPAAYDETRGQYYLNQGEAIVFGYMCDIGPSDKTKDAATNAVAMPYTDQPATGVSIVPAADMRVSAGGSGFEDANDGSRAAMSAASVKAKYGFTDSSGDRTWLVSDVTVRRGEIIPGVTKVTESYTTQGGITNEYTTHVSPTDVVNWSVTLSNGGAQAITDYTFEDSMPSPYVIVGDITGTIRDKDGKVVLTQTLLSFPENRSENETSVTVTRNRNPYKVTLGETETDFGDGLSISLSREGGNEVLKLHLRDASFSIPEGGTMEIGLSSKNPTTNMISTVYTNYATLTPTQAFTRHGEGQIDKDGAGKPVSVGNYSSVTVATGLVTSSEKRVTDGTHTAVSSGQGNTILLPDAGKEFTYTLSVTNSTGDAMEKLVLIDNLPEVDDHSPFSKAAPRGSEFKVSLAAPDVTVKVTAKDGTETTLTPSQYTVQYAEGTDFGKPQSPDWKGESTGTTANWTTSPANARAIRIIIKDPPNTGSKVGPVIPNGATVSVTFRAKVEGDAAPGSIAWNSFGYHYAIDTTELESMPMVVGVKVPDIPALEKKLVDVSGAPAAAEQAETFQFLLYTGEALPGSYVTQAEWEKALAEANRNYHVFSVIVPKGASTSGETLLEAKGWTWTENQKYTIVELPGDGRYAFRSFDGKEAAQHTFAYHGAETLTITCENLFQKWRIGLTKVDHTNPSVSLPGAVFALYSPEQSDKIDNVPAEYQPTIQNGTETWYLAKVGTTGADGTLAFEDLLREKYYLLEVKAPAGYALSETPGQTIYRTAAKDGAYTLTVENRKGYELPEAGGAGTAPYTLGGLLALCAGVLLLYKKCKKEGSASS